MTSENFIKRYYAASFAGVIYSAYSRNALCGSVKHTNSGELRIHVFVIHFYHKDVPTHCSQPYGRFNSKKLCGKAYR